MTWNALILVKISEKNARDSCSVQKKLSHLKYDQDLPFNSYLGIPDKLVSRSP